MINLKIYFVKKLLTKTDTKLKDQNSELNILFIENATSSWAICFVLCNTQLKVLFFFFSPVVK